ncbi:hypothetical protein RIF29_30684 [Crotalaria pallida]|uniref:Uncharacterized protein n=1 Tax=Crotalaria pallida TaxID=3830 RepID=A0AAN9EH63_CROPI
MYASAAQYNCPPRRPLVNKICGAIDGASINSDILAKINAGFEAYIGNRRCKINGPFYVSESLIGWAWQCCREHIG